MTKRDKKGLFCQIGEISTLALSENTKKSKNQQELRAGRKGRAGKCALF